jgi:iron(III) transport system substrate-binding protein
MTTPRSRRLGAAAVAAALAVALTACGEAGADDADALTIYSGRTEELVGPLLDQLEEAVGTQVDVRYAGSSELAAQLLEEGEATDADVFFSQDAGALGALAKAGRLEPLPDDVRTMVPDQFTDDEGRWVGTSARSRVVAFDPRLAPEVGQMHAVDQVLDERYRGRIGFAPTNASFHSFVTALRVERGEDAARQWLQRFAALQPQAYESNVAVLDAVDSGEVALGLINHYYWYEKVAEVGQDAVTARIHFLDRGDPGALVNVAGAGVLAGSEQEDAAVRAVKFLLSEQAQRYFADQTAEYPVVEGVTSTKFDLQPLGDANGSAIDLNELDSLDTTLAMLDEVGLT